MNTILIRNLGKSMAVPNLTMAVQGGVAADCLAWAFSVRRFLGGEINLFSLSGSWKSK